ncbi:MAG: DUF1565 domain-containing protein [Phaeodactylibacter sp.]|nr:DUF1565 domain-containing protein [Phaeodactylibacter sp.]
MLKYHVALFCSLITPFLGSAQEGRIYVNQANGNPMQDGQSWASAYSNLTEALQAAQVGDSIWVAAGTYYPTDGANRELSFTLKTGVQLYGGFNGDEEGVEARDYLENITLLSGDIGIPGDSTDNSYHVLRAIAPDNNTVLDGLHIRYGNADLNGFDSRYGGGLFVSTPGENTDTPAHIQIRNCFFTRNNAKDGGAIAFNSPTNKGITPTIINCTFTSNRAYASGGAIHRNDDNGIGDTVLFQGCLFLQNRALVGGGAIDWGVLGQPMVLRNCSIAENTCVSSGGGVNFTYMKGNSSLAFEGCSIVKNTGNTGGGVYLYFSANSLSDSATVHIKQSEFNGNIATSDGGGGLAFLIIGIAKQSLFLENTHFIDNRAPDRGAGVYVELMDDIKSRQTVNACTFIRNRGASPLGGAYWIRGFLGNISQNYNTFTNCIFANNTGVASIASGIPGVSESLFLNCTFYNNGSYDIAKNWAPDFDYQEYYNRIAVHNCIFQLQGPNITMYNHLLNGYLEGYEDNLFDYTISHSMVSTPDCDLLGGGLACGQGMQYAVSPQFVDPQDGDFRISACSPAIDAGRDSLLLELGITKSLDGSPRFIGANADLGAYEQPAISLQLDSILPPTCPGGENGILWLQPTGTPPFQYELERIGVGLVPPTLDSLAAGEYHLALIDRMGCRDTANFVITGVDSILAEAITEPATQLAGGSISITGLNGGTPPYQLEWDNGLHSHTIEGLQPGEYTLMVTDSNGCQAVFAYEIDYIDGLSAKQGEQFFRLYPNPSQGAFTLAYDLKQEALLHLYNSIGLPVLMQKLQAGRQEIHWEPGVIKAGFYNMCITSNERRMLFTEKLVLIE